MAARSSCEVKTVGNDGGAVRETAQWAEIVVMAVPFAAIDAAVKEAGPGLEGKPLIDVTNALGPDMQLAVGFDSSGAEELQKKARGARVVKAFNTVFAQHMDSGRVGGEHHQGGHTAPVCYNSPGAEPIAWSSSK